MKKWVESSPVTALEEFLNYSNKDSAVASGGTATHGVNGTACGFEGDGEGLIGVASP